MVSVSDGSSSVLDCLLIEQSSCSQSRKWSPSSSMIESVEKLVQIQVALFNSHYDFGHESSLLLSSTSASPSLSSALRSARLSHQLTQVFDAHAQSEHFRSHLSLGRTLQHGCDAVKTVVKVAVDKSNKENHAVKIVPLSRVESLRQWPFLLAEALISCAVNFPFLVRTVGRFNDNHLNLVFVQELIEGGDLFEHHQLQGSFTEPQARFYIAQLVLVLEYLHNCHVVYRDLKPENLILDPSGYLKLVDLGYAKRLNPPHFRDEAKVGTEAFMAPEVGLTDYTFNVDWWSLGVLLFEMVAGQTPFESNNRREGLYTCPMHFSQDLKNLLSHLIVVDPTKRYPEGCDFNIKSHPWFKYINWVDLYHKRLKPHFVPGSKIDLQNL